MAIYNILSAILLLSLGVVYGAKCDDTRECIRDTITGSDKMLCFGYYGCKGATLDSDQKAICSGAKACRRAKFTLNVATILCNGYASCQRGRDMKNNNKIACNGLKACTDIVGGIEAPEILCDGDIACTNIKSKKNSDLSLNLNAVGNGAKSLLYCNGNGVCKDTQQRSDGLIYCDGDGACKESRQQAQKVSCQGKRACKDTIIQPQVGGTLKSVECQGWFGCAGANVIMAEEIKAYGFNGLANSVIETRGIPTFNLKAYGFRALAGSSIDCKGTDCTIECKGNACKGVPISVAKSSTLTLDPAACDPNDPDFELNKKNSTNGIGGKVAGVSCPSVLYARADQTEEEIAAWRQSFVDSWKESEEYQEYLEMEEMAEQESEAYIEERLRDYEMLNEYDDEEGDDEFFAGQDSQYLFGGGNVSVQTQIASSLITSNLLTAVVVFLLTGGLIHVIFNKYRNGYKSLQ